jgi:hypothetical protein
MAIHSPDDHERSEISTALHCPSTYHPVTVGHQLKSLYSNSAQDLRITQSHPTPKSPPIPWACHFEIWLLHHSVFSNPNRVFIGVSGSPITLHARFAAFAELFAVLFRYSPFPYSNPEESPFQFTCQGAAWDFITPEKRTAY